jgi:hypothetical protein
MELLRILYEDFHGNPQNAAVFPIQNFGFLCSQELIMSARYDFPLIFFISHTTSTYV